MASAGIRPYGGPSARRDGDEAHGHRGAVSPSKHLEAGTGAQDVSLPAVQAAGDAADTQVWAIDITYIPMARGFVYLTAVVDWFSRKVLS
jgi:transposase InsO family protein